ncbi:hypothetical protein PoB_007484900 [Plakobranchus ocellatus]|uniref:Uncharacterized protein n=1 Tax=Plakobranchus ocellatus TaxID=259542 RepID=A0AAV4DWA7_9GAST|nr:hypothetical protein PoB_007484900 [Plakobranchus ocellatus]
MSQRAALQVTAIFLPQPKPVKLALKKFHRTPSSAPIYLASLYTMTGMTRDKIPTAAVDVRQPTKLAESPSIAFVSKSRNEDMWISMKQSPIRNTEEQNDLPPDHQRLQANKATGRRHTFGLRWLSPFS